MLVCQIQQPSKLTFFIHSPGHNVPVELVCQMSVHNQLTFFFLSLGHNGEIQLVCQMITQSQLNSLQERATDMDTGSSVLQDAGTRRH